MEETTKTNQNAQVSTKLDPITLTVIEKITKVTTAWAERNGYDVTPDPAKVLTERAQKMRAFLASGVLGGHNDKARLFAKIIMGDELPDEEAPKKLVAVNTPNCAFDKLVAIVTCKPDAVAGPLNNKVGIPVLITGFNQSYYSYSYGVWNIDQKIEAYHGSRISIHSDYWRPANSEEIENLARLFVSETF